MSNQQQLPDFPFTANLEDAAEKIAPVWPLGSFVAVNPYVGMANDDFASVAKRLQRVAGAWSTMPTAFYLEALDQGRMTIDDVSESLRAAGRDDCNAFIEEARRAALVEEAPQPRVSTVADVATVAGHTDWTRFVTDRISAWAAAYFDEGQAAWGPVRFDKSLYAAWRAEAELDRTPELLGLKGFRTALRRLPSTPLEAAETALRQLDLEAPVLELYLHRLLARCGGWAAYARRVVWDAKLYEGRDDDTLIQLLCILLSWEVAMMNALELESTWAVAKTNIDASNAEEDASLDRRLVLQNAFERTAQRKLVAAFEDAAAATEPPRTQRPAAQAIFCIDVRSEVYRRHLEAAAPSIETLGFAGFFAFPVEHRPLGHESGGTQCPVLLTPAAKVDEGLKDSTAEAQALERRRRHHEIRRAWKAFKMGAVSCFSFVGPLGLAYLPRLFTDGFGWTRPVPHPSREGLSKAEAQAKDVRLDYDAETGTGLSLEQRVALAQVALQAMSLTSNFARLVLLTGHGSTTVNNPHATGLDCGACGGRTGEANARVAAHTLNDPQVRAALAQAGLQIPADTVFLACQHDTTTDEVEIFNRSAVPASLAEELSAVEAALVQAGRTCRMERAARLPAAGGGSVDQQILARSRDWAQVRPEWGLAGCQAFIVAPRRRTQKLDLGGRAFLHSYEWRGDEGFSVLELVMTAPMVVASWISLQYYGSTVDNPLFGCGDKTLHNVVGTVGVLEGNGGDLRVGLPWQSLHDGESLQHEPLRLNVLIEAPTEAMNEIIGKHESVRQLVDNGWLHLYAINDDGRLSHRYVGDLRWRSLEDNEAAAMVA